MDNSELNEALFTEFPEVTTGEWEKKIMADLKGADYAKKLLWDTGEGFLVKPYYRTEDLEGLEYLVRLKKDQPAISGQGQGNNWIIRQDILTSDITEANRLAIDAVAHGANAVGLNAKEITTHKQMTTLLQGINLAKTWVYFIASKSYPLTLELYIYEMTSGNLNGGNLQGGLNFDPLSFLLLKGDFYVNFSNNLEEAEYLINTISKRLPQFRSLTVNAHVFQNSGSTLVQELAFSLASGNEYLNALTSKGISIDSLARKMIFHYACGPNYFMEIAKLRAARILWARVVEQYKPSGQQSLRMFIHASTAEWNKTVYDPYVNMLRTTTEGMSAAIGNTDSLSIGAFDTAFRNPEGFSSRIARNQQLIFKEEAYLDRISDPAAGAYYIERLTDSLAQHAWELFRKVESMGGMIEAVKAGFIQDEIEKNRLQKEADLAQRKAILIGTNQFPESHEMMLGKIEVSTPGNKQESSTFKTLRPFRVSLPIEELRLATEEFTKNGNHRPKVFLFTFGNVAMMRARAGFAANFFGCAGFAVTDNPGFSSIEEGIQAVIDKSPDIVVLCSSDEEYEDLASAGVPEMKAVLPKIIVVVAGYPKEKIDILKNTGVDEFIHVRSNLLESLKKFSIQLGITSHKPI